MFGKIGQAISNYLNYLNPSPKPTVGSKVAIVSEEIQKENDIWNNNLATKTPDEDSQRAYSEAFIKNSIAENKLTAETDETTKPVEGAGNSRA